MGLLLWWQTTVAAKKLVADPGSYALTGTSAGTLYGRKVDATVAGSYALTGTDAGTLHGWKVDATVAGSYALTGTAAGTFYGRKIDATTAGSYALTGTDATLREGFAVQATAGSYALTGTDAATLHGWKLDATTAGSYALVGVDAVPFKTTVGAFVIIAEPGSYALTGTDANLLHGWKLDGTTAGSYALTGIDATLTYQPVAPVITLPTRGEWPERKKRRQREDARHEKVVTARQARDQFRQALERLYDGGEYDAPLEVLEEAETEALVTVNVITQLPEIPLAELQAAEELIRRIQEILRLRQIDEMQAEAASQIAAMHLRESIDIAQNVYRQSRSNWLARTLLLIAE